MKQTTTLVLLFLFFGITVNLRAQSAKTEDEEATRKRIEYQVYHMKRTSEQAVDVNVADNKYNHREKEIFEKLNTDAIPADFPVYKPEYTNEQYTALMDAWYKANPTLLKKETNTNNKNK